ncbi:universal stress protein [Parvularcula sp. ZS-1/3]|uniref:Universal stress protein n=1 Tax=Parvularcula mediterranea TaxID=2732508 RepID=A0A7Y3RKM4_9PROT|nr:universal stress protein [Parvularcula mediterranea]NNU15796.1 universal stress protein [Parvularcula mediterranea]
MSEVERKVVRPRSFPESGPIAVAAAANERGGRAVARGCQLARELRRDLAFVQIIDGTAFRERRSTELSDLETRTGEAPGLSGLEVAVAAYPGHHVDHEYGRAVTLCDHLGDVGAGLVVIGTRDIGAKNKPLSGSMTQRLLQYTPCPVLVAQNAAPEPYHKVVVAADFSEVSESLIRQALDLAPEASIEVLTAIGAKDDPDEVLKEFRMLTDAAAFSEDARRRLSFRTIPGHAKKILASEIARLAPDLLVLGTRGRSAVAQLILGSVSSAFADNPPCDLLLIRSAGQH